MKSREPDPLSKAYAAVWSTRTTLGDDSVALLYIEMHRADLDPILVTASAVLDFTTFQWENGTPPAEFTRQLRRNAWRLYWRSLKRAAAANLQVVRAILDAGRS